MILNVSMLITTPPSESESENVLMLITLLLREIVYWSFEEKVKSEKSGNVVCFNACAGALKRYCCCCYEVVKVKKPLMFCC